MELYHVGKKKGKVVSKYQIELNKVHILAKNKLISPSITVGLKVLNAMVIEEVEDNVEYPVFYNMKKLLLTVIL